MSMTLINHLLQSYGYLAVFLFVALESTGVPLPGETALIAAALYAGSAHRLNIGLIALVAAIAAIAGDNGGYWLGQHGGTRLVRRYGHWVRLDARKLKIGRYLFARHGGKVVFFGRFITVLRTYVAFFAGLNGMRRSRFLVANAAAAVLWAAAVSFGAYALGNAATQVGTALTIAGLAVAGALLIAGALFKRKVMRRARGARRGGLPGPAADRSGQRASRGALTSPYPQPRHRRNGHENHIACQTCRTPCDAAADQVAARRQVPGRTWLTDLRVKLTELAPFTAEIVPMILGFPAS